MSKENLTRLQRRVKSKTSKWRKHIKKMLPVWWKKIRVWFYGVRLKIFLGRRSTWVLLASHFIRRKFVYLSIIYLAMALYITWLSGHYSPPKNDATTFFSAAGAMIGAALAIILTFNTLIINFAGSEFPPEFYKATGYDWRQSAIYFLLAADAVALFVFCLVFKSPAQHTSLWLFPLSIFIICQSFYVLFASYLVTRKRLDPVVGLATIRKIAIKHLAKGAKAGDKLAKVFATNPNLKPEQKGLARREAYRLMAPTLEQVSQINGYLHDYHDKLIEKQNFATASRVLDAIYDVMAKYIEIRRDNMQARATPYFLAFTTDSQGFFEKNLQQLIDKAKRYMEAKNTTGAIHITDLMCKLAQQACTVEFGMPTENPLLDQVQSYLGLIADEAVAKGDVEVLFHLADVYSVLGRQAIKKNLQLAKSSAYNQLVKIGQAGAVAKQTSVVGRVADAFTALLKALHEHGEIYPGIEPQSLFDSYQKVLIIYCAAINGSQTYINNPQMLAPYNTALSWMAEIASRPVDQLDHSARSDFIELADIIRSSMREMSGIIPLGNHSITIEMGTMIRSVTSLMLNLRSRAEWQSSDDELISTAGWYTHQLTWFMEKTESATENITRELADNAGEIGLRALETNTEKIVKASVEAISYLANYLQQKVTKDNGYDSARIMQTACLVGIYAKQLGMNEVYELAKTKAVEFNTAFNQKHFPEGPPVIPGGRSYIGLHPDQLIRELNSLYAEPNYEYDILSSSTSFNTLEEKFGQHITRENVHSFIAEISPILPPETRTETS